MVLEQNILILEYSRCGELSHHLLDLWTVRNWTAYSLSNS